MCAWLNRINEKSSGRMLGFGLGPMANGPCSKPNPISDFCLLLFLTFYLSYLPKTTRACYKPVWPTLMERGIWWVLP